jgi:hypothetical protein
MIVRTARDVDWATAMSTSLIQVPKIGADRKRGGGNLRMTDEMGWLSSCNYMYISILHHSNGEINNGGVMVLSRRQDKVLTMGLKGASLRSQISSCRYCLPRRWKQPFQMVQPMRARRAAPRLARTSFRLR